MSITWNNSSSLKGFVYELFDNASAWSLSLVELFQFHKPFQTFLIGQTVKWTSKSIQCSGIRQIRVCQSWADQIWSMCWDVSTFMIRMNRKITSETFSNLVIIKSKHVSKICCPIKAVVSLDKLWISVFMSINRGSDTW